MGIKSINLLESVIPELVLSYDVFIIKPFGTTMHNIQDVCLSEDSSALDTVSYSVCAV